MTPEESEQYTAATSCAEARAAAKAILWRRLSEQKAEIEARIGDLEDEAALLAEMLLVLEAP